MDLGVPARAPDPGRGVAVLLRGGEQAALFLLDGRHAAAVGNIDPFGRAAVMSRGLVGDRGGEPIVASPLLKQAFSLIDGRCLDDESGPRCRCTRSESSGGVVAGLSTSAVPTRHDLSRPTLARALPASPSGSPRLAAPRSSPPC